MLTIAILIARPGPHHAPKVLLTAAQWKLREVEGSRKQGGGSRKRGLCQRRPFFAGKLQASNRVLVLILIQKLASEVRLFFTHRTTSSSTNTDTSTRTS